MTDTECVLQNPPRLVGSRDPHTGSIFFPPRAFSADGQLRPCETVELHGTGTLFSWTRFAGTSFGQIDLLAGVRIQTVLEEAEHEIGAEYGLVVRAADNGTIEWSFARV